MYKKLKKRQRECSPQCGMIEHMVKKSYRKKAARKDFKCFNFNYRERISALDGIFQDNFQFFFFFSSSLQYLYFYCSQKFLIPIITLVFPSISEEINLLSLMVFYFLDDERAPIKCPIYFLLLRALW